MTLEGFKPLRKGSLIGFASVKLPIGLVITDIPICTSHGKSWAALPSKLMVDRDGQPMVDSAGKRKYVPILSWSDRETSNKWSEAVIALVNEAHPGALDDDR